MKKASLFFAVIAWMFTTNVNAQQDQDIKGSKDYPLIPRFENATINYYKVFKWQDYNVPLSKMDSREGIGDYFPKQVNVEGKVIRMQYTTPSENNPAYVYKTYLQNLKAAGFKILFNGKDIAGIGDNSEDFCDLFYSSKNTGKLGMKFYPRGADTHGFIVAKTTKDSNNIYAIVYISGFGDVTLITQDVIEADKENILSENSLIENLDVYGHLSVYSIFFDTGKYTIKPESEAALSVIAAYLKNHPDTHFLIVGHTDNVGEFEANKLLSENRAKAVLNELVTKYSIPNAQLKAYGVANLAPIATNTTDEGRAKNRRVEIVVE